MAKVKAPPSNDILWDMTPHKGEYATGYMTSWYTQCGRYRICRTISKFVQGALPQFGCVLRVRKEGKIQELLIDLDKQASGYYARYYTSIVDAIDVVEAYHRRKHGTVTASNKMELVIAASNDGLAGEMKTPPKELGEEDRILTILAKGPLTVDGIARILQGANVRVTLLRMLRGKQVIKEGNLYGLPANVK